LLYYREMNEPTRDQLDLLLRLERLTEELNRQMSQRSKFVLKRYPLTFGLLALFGVVAVSEGAKGVLEELGLLHSPAYLLLGGLILLLILGSVYKKLEK
jgi:hypothetical protein